MPYNHHMNGLEVKPNSIVGLKTSNITACGCEYQRNYCPPTDNQIITSLFHKNCEQLNENYQYNEYEPCYPMNCKQFLKEFLRQRCIQTKNRSKLSGEVIKLKNSNVNIQVEEQLQTFGLGNLAKSTDSQRDQEVISNKECIQPTNLVEFEHKLEWTKNRIRLRQNDGITKGPFFSQPRFYDGESETYDQNQVNTRKNQKLKEQLPLDSSEKVINLNYFIKPKEENDTDSGKCESDNNKNHEQVQADRYEPTETKSENLHPPPLYSPIILPKNSKYDIKLYKKNQKSSNYRFGKKSSCRKRRSQLQNFELGNIQNNSRLKSGEDTGRTTTTSNCKLSRKNEKEDNESCRLQTIPETPSKSICRSSAILKIRSVGEFIPYKNRYMYPCCQRHPCGDPKTYTTTEKYQPSERIPLFNYYDIRQRPPNLYGEYKKATEVPRVLNNEMEIQYNEDKSVQLDYDRIVDFLKTARPEKKIPILQALRWRITNTSDVVRNRELKNINKNDLLGLRNHFLAPNRKLLDELLWPTSVIQPHPLQDTTARLIHALAATEIGRDYFSSTSVVQSLVFGEEVHDRKDVDINASDHLIAAMTKLAINPFQRGDMIRKGLLKWLANHIEHVEYSCTTYHFKYMCALLKVLVTRAKESTMVLDSVKQILSFFARTLERGPKYGDEHIRGTMFALFRYDRAAASARAMDFGVILKERIRLESDATVKLEFSHILELLYHPKSRSEPILSCCNSLTADGEYLDKEIGMHERETKNVKQATGEHYLEKNFSLSIILSERCTATKWPDPVTNLERDLLISEDSLNTHDPIDEEINKLENTWKGQAIKSYQQIVHDSTGSDLDHDQPEHYPPVNLLSEYKKRKAQKAIANANNKNCPPCQLPHVDPKSINEDEHLPPPMIEISPSIAEMQCQMAETSSTIREVPHPMTEVPTPITGNGTDVRDNEKPRLTDNTKCCVVIVNKSSKRDTKMITKMIPCDQSHVRRDLKPRKSKKLKKDRLSSKSNVNPHQETQLKAKSTKMLIGTRCRHRKQPVKVKNPTSTDQLTNIGVVENRQQLQQLPEVNCNVETRLLSTNEAIINVGVNGNIILRSITWTMDDDIEPRDIELRTGEDSRGNIIAFIKQRLAYRDRTDSGFKS